MDEFALAAAYVSLGVSILASGTMIGGAVYYFVSLLERVDYKYSHQYFSECGF